MNPSRSNLSRLTAALAVVGLALAACGDDEPGAGDPLPGDVATTSSTSSTIAVVVVGSSPEDPPPAPEPEPAPEPTPAADPEPTPAADPEPEPEGAECLIGDWLITDAEMNSYYDALAAGSSSPGAELSIDTTGEVLLSLTATTYVYVGAFDLTVSVAGQTGTGAATGSVNGSWAADGNVLRTELESSNLGIVVTVSGVTFDGSDLGNGLLQADPINNAPYSCDGPTIMFQSGPTDDIRHPVVLTPV